MPKKKIDTTTSLVDAPEKFDKLVKLAYDDQCMGANSAYPLMSKIKKIYINAFNGVV